jgi:hypothetical protein
MLMLQYIDAYVGIPSIIYDTDAERRKLYGKAGCFRLTKYGFEYRTLSSYWIGSPKRMQFIWNQLMRALNAFEQRCILPDCSLVRDSINNNDIQTANALIETYNLIDPENVIPD